MPFAIRDAVGHELDRLEADTIIEKVTYAEWAAPIVAVPKKDGRLSIYGDCKFTINPVLEIVQHPLHDLKSCLLHCLVARNLLP